MYEFMTVNEVAKIFRMSPRRVQEYALAGEPTGFKSAKPFGRVLIYKSSVAEKLGCKVEEL